MAHEQFTTLDVLASIKKLLPLVATPEPKKSKKTRNTPSSTPGPQLISEYEMEELTSLFLSIDSAKVQERKLDDITQFASIHELLSVLIQAIQTHAMVTSMKNGSCLSEISILNIILAEFPRIKCKSDMKGKDGKRQAKSCSKTRRDSSEEIDSTGSEVYFGFLLDHTQDDEEIVYEDPEVTQPFKSIDALLTPVDEFVRRPYHDLESFFYILLWLCIISSRQKGVRRKKFDITSTALHAWYAAPSDAACGEAKRQAMLNAECFEEDVLKHVALNFRDLKPLLRSLREVLFASGTTGGEMTHQKMIEMLRNALVGFAPKQRPKI